jgi:type IV secretory pathway TraG/TraD family ATPase VirD4
LNAEAIESALFVNCQHKLYYCALDADTAEWVSRSSGTESNEAVRSESTSVNKYGGETWGDTRQIVQQETAYVTINKISALPERVGVLFRPNTLPETIYTCWVPADKSVDLYKVPKAKEPNA